MYKRQPEETGLTFLENALLKARSASAQTGLPAIADDSGLAVDYLDVHPVSTRRDMQAQMPPMRKIILN